MSTASIVSEIKLKAPNWSRDGSDSAILNFIQRAQLFLFSKPSQFSLLIDETTGDYPYLTTIAGQRKYVIPDITRSMLIDGVAQDITLRISRVDQLFTEAGSAVDYGFMRNGMTLFESGVKSYGNGKTQYRFSCVPATETESAYILLPFDPGASTEQFKMVALIEPLRLTADTIPLMIPEDWEYILVEGALGWIEYHDVGRSDRLDKFKKEYAREFWYRFNSPIASIEYNGRASRRF
jgi:hypothetical protein